MRKSRLTCAAVIAALLLSGCAGAAPGRAIFDTRDMIVEAEIPSTGFWYIAEATAADAVDDVEVEFGPLFSGDAPPDARVGLAPLRTSHSWPYDQDQIEVDFEVTSFDGADNAEVRCSVYFEGRLLVEDVGVGASPSASCTGVFELSDYLS